MIERGRGERFRQPSLFERLAVGAGAFLPHGWRGRASDAYARLVDLVQRGQLVADLPHGERVRLLPRHRYLAWNPEEYHAFRADVRPGDCILDVGANIGAYTVLFAHWAGPHGRVIAFEPAPEPHRALRELLVLNGVSHRVVVLEQAVSSERGTAIFQANGTDGGNRLLHASAAGAVRVETTTIDETCGRLELVPSLIKVDAEGAELAVLRGARRTIASAPALRVYVEMHPRLWPAFNTSRAAIEAELRSQGLRAERLDGSPDIWNIEGVCLRLVRCAS